IKTGDQDWRSRLEIKTGDQDWRSRLEIKTGSQGWGSRVKSLRQEFETGYPNGDSNGV
ncbi:hypothetical protein E4U61_000774, partial [Claviceps capensis]